MGMDPVETNEAQVSDPRNSFRSLRPRGMNVPALNSTFTSVVIGAEKMQGYIRLVSNDPTVMARGHVKDVASAHFDDTSVIHSSGGTPRYHHANMLNLARSRACGGADVDRPAPSGLVDRSPDGDTSQAHNLESTFLVFAYLVRFFELL